MEDDFYIEVGIYQRNHHGERICGDVFVSQRLKEEKRMVAVLSDGMGHGVKANMLSTLTATMAMNFTKEHKDARKIAEIIMKTLPVCSERKISYSTFSIIDIDEKLQTTIINFDNPRPLLVRNNEIYKLQWKDIHIETVSQKGREIQTCTFWAQKQDRIVLMSDGVSQSGLGPGKYSLGWGVENIEKFIIDSLVEKPDLSASKLAAKLVNKANAIDVYVPKDDISAAVVYLRQPRKMILNSGPPFDKENDKNLAVILKEFNGLKVICGGTTASIVANEWNLPIKDSLIFEDPDLPPDSYLEGVDLVTEGILTLSKVANILEKWNPRTELGKGPADTIVKMFLEVDAIRFLVGTAINVAHQDPNLPVELEIRRTVVNRIARLLEKKFLKETSLQFI